MLGLQKNIECSQPRLLFDINGLSFCLFARQIDAVIKDSRLVSSSSLPDFFVGYMVHRRSLIPCVNLRSLVGSRSDCDDATPQKAIILKAQNDARRPCLGIAVKQVVASTVPKKENLYPLRQRYQNQEWLSYELIFGEQSYLGINHQGLLVEIENA